MHIALCYILVCSEMKTHISRPISLICQKSLYTIILNRMCMHNRIVRHSEKKACECQHAVIIHSCDLEKRSCPACSILS